MSEHLQLCLLGAPRIRLGAQPLTGFVHNKAQALLFYVAVTGQPHSRDALATLLWGEMAEAQAKNNLRRVLPELRHLVGQHLVIERQTIGFQRTSPHWLDVDVVRRGLTPQQSPTDLATWQAAVDLYQGEFLHGFYVRDAPAFDEWVLAQREQLHTLLVNALERLVQAYVQRSDTTAALAANRRLLTLEPWSEPTHRRQMFLLAQTGERAAALAQYEACQRILAAEFGIAPLPETTALYAQIQRGEVGSLSNGETSQPLLVVEPLPTSVSPTIANESAPTAIRQRPEPNDLPTRQVAGHNMPLRTQLYGRQAELASLHKWVVADGCQVVGIFGIGGQGKTALAAAFVHTLTQPVSPPNAAGPFQHILWQSLLNAPPLAEVLQAWIAALSDQTEMTLPPSLDQQVSHLLDDLRRQRCLLILDNLESILQSDERSGQYRPGYEAYGQLVRHLAAGGHRSCLLLTSRERPQALSQLEEESPAVRSLALAGLAADAGRQMLTRRGLSDRLAGLDALVQHYSGNPLALSLAAETVQEIFDGNITTFLQADTLIFDDVRDVLDQQFARLTPLERELLGWLAIVREPIPFNALRNFLAQPPASHRILEAVRSLQRRSLLEKFEDGFGLQNVVLEYITDRLVEGISQDLLDDQRTALPDAIVTLSPPHPGPSLSLHPLTQAHVNRYALILAQVKEYVRASQMRLLLQPVLEHLLARLGHLGTLERLRRLLADLRTMPRLPGYAAANLLHLLLQLGVEWDSYDFSRLSIRQAYLRGVSLPKINLTSAEILESVFTEPFGIVNTAVFSPDGRYLAAGMTEGSIYLWHTADQQLAQVLQSHQQGINQLAFAQRMTAAGDSQLVLASASADKHVGFWVLAAPRGLPPQVRWQVRLTHAQQASVIAISFSVDGQRLTSVDGNGQVSVWDVSTQADARLVHHFATHPTRFGLVAFGGDGQTIAVGQRDGAVQLWNSTSGEAGLLLPDPTSSTGAVAIRADGQQLVTGGRKGHLRLWSLPSGQLRQEIETQAGAIDALAFSADGHLLASTHGDRAVRLWSVDAQRGLQLRHTLLGHRQMIWSVGFGSQPTAAQAQDMTAGAVTAQHLLVTGSSDQTVRVWDVESSQARYTLHGQPRALALMAISPRPATPSSVRVGTAWQLAAVSYDQGVHIWQGQGAQVDNTHRTFHGTPGLPYTVALSHDARIVASAGSAHVIDLWDVASGQRRQTLHGHTNSVLCLAFAPKGASSPAAAGELLASGSTDGTVRLWALSNGEYGQLDAAKARLPDQPVAILAANPRYVYDLAFSPDGRVLATVGADCSLRLWDMRQSPPVELVAARKTVQEAGEQDLFAVTFSPDGTKLACGSNHQIYLWDWPSDALANAQNTRSAEAGELQADRTKPLLLPRQHTGWILTLAFSPDGTLLASSGADGTVCLWDVASRSLRMILRGHTETIYKVLFSPDGAVVLSCSFDGSIKFWDPQRGDCLQTLAVEGPYAGMNITDVTGLTQAQKTALRALGAVEV